MSQRKNRKEKAVEALLEHGTLTAAAKAAGVSRRTLQRWMDEPDFAAQVRAARARAHGLAMNRIAHAASEAVEVLLRGMRGDEITRVELWSAKAILELASLVQQADLESRIDELEALIRDVTENL
jgi:phage terminase small subunit